MMTKVQRQKIVHTHWNALGFPSRSSAYSLGTSRMACRYQHMHFTCDWMAPIPAASHCCIALWTFQLSCFSMEDTFQRFHFLAGVIIPFLGSCHFFSLPQLSLLSWSCWLGSYQQLQLLPLLGRSAPWICSPACLLNSPKNLAVQSISLPAENAWCATKTGQFCVGLHEALLIWNNPGLFHQLRDVCHRRLHSLVGWPVCQIQMF